MFQMPSNFPNLLCKIWLLCCICIYLNKIFSQFISGGADFIKIIMILPALTTDNWSWHTQILAGSLTLLYYYLSHQQSFSKLQSCSLLCWIKNLLLSDHLSLLCPQQKSDSMGCGVSQNVLHKTDTGITCRRCVMYYVWEMLLQDITE